MSRCPDCENTELPDFMSCRFVQHRAVGFRGYSANTNPGEHEYLVVAWMCNFAEVRIRGKLDS